jgi:PST family polysaccharide transporter
LYGTQFLLNLGKNKLFMFVFLLVAIVNCIMIYPLTLFFNIRGTAVSVVFTELLLCIGMVYFAQREYKKLLNED